MTKRPSLNLEGKKDLILHTYDLFLITQTRLFVQSCSNTRSDSSEINRRRELLLLDDLMGFAISSRRLIELTHLKSFANRCTIPMAHLDCSEEPYQVTKIKDKTIGFHTLMNRLVHSSVIQHIDDILDLALLVQRPSHEIRERIIWNRIVNKSRIRQPMEQLLFVSTDEINPVLFSIDDMIMQSIVVAEKVLETCNDSKIFLELDMRGAD